MGDVDPGRRVEALAVLIELTDVDSHSGVLIVVCDGQFISQTYPGLTSTGLTACNWSHEIVDASQNSSTTCVLRRTIRRTPATKHAPLEHLPSRDPANQMFVPG